MSSLAASLGLEFDKPLEFTVSFIAHFISNILKFSQLDEIERESNLPDRPIMGHGGFEENSEDSDPALDVRISHCLLATAQG
jgi:hypothetical protein